MTLPAPAPRGCSHWSVEEDGHKVERDGEQRFVYTLGTCRHCGKRLEYRQRMTNPWRPPWRERLDETG